jgi:hypothetical protein
VKSVLVIVAASTVAHAEPPRTAEEVRGAPVPGEESGRVDVREPDSVGRKVGRAALWLPRATVMALAQPVRGALYLDDRHAVVHRIVQVFVTDDQRIALYPTALFETGLGLNVGARGFVKDMFGSGERLHVRAGFGGEYRWIATGGLHGGDRFAPVDVRIEATRAALDREWFYGIGNDSEPMASDANRYREEVARGYLTAAVRMPARLRAKGTIGLTRKGFEEVDPAAAPMFDAVPGFREGTEFVYGELELARDSRRAAHPWDAPGMRGTGSFAAIYGGLQRADDVAFVRTGFDVQRYLRLTSRPRVIGLRIAGEAVVGPDHIPFSELPRIGGESVLRGYPSGRFRDRMAAFAQASYSWAAANWLAPVLFVDAGRVYAGFDELSVDQLHVGFGAGLEGYSRRGLVARFELASSIDGGIYLHFALNPAFNSGARMERN